MRPEHLSLYRQPGRPAPHPDATWAAVAISRPDLEEDIYPSRLWRLDLAGGGLTPLTHGTADSSPVISPDGAWLAFVRGGKGTKPQLALMATTGGEPLVLTDHPVGVSGVPVFSPDSRRIAYTARVPEEGRYGTTDGVGPDAEPPRLVTDFAYRGDGLGYLLDRPQQVFVVDVPAAPDVTADAPTKAEDETTSTDDSTGEKVPASVAAWETGVEPVQVTTGPAPHTAPVWLDHGDLLVMQGVQDALGDRLVRVSATAGATPAVVETTGAPSTVAVGDDGTLWLLVVDLGEDGQDFIGRSPALVRARLTETGLTDLERLTDPAVDGLGELLVPVPGGVVVTRGHRGTEQLCRYDVATSGLQVLLDGDVEVSGARALGTEGAVVASVAEVGSVGDVHVVAADGAARRATDLSARLREVAGVLAPQELEVTGEDGYPVHGWVALPEGDGPHPVLLMIHGGPASAYGPTFFDEAQVYAGAGYAVVFCNPRGSSSYGQEHARSIIGGFGDRDEADVLAFLAGALAAHPELDGDRVGVLGGSYGGYMTAWLTTRDHRWKGAVVERGFLDPVSFVGSSDIGWFFGGRYLGEDPEQVAAQSPMAHVDQVRTPTLVIHSEQDWRCPVEQGQRWFTELRRRGVETELLLFPGEGHELSRAGRPKHRLARFEHILRWWDRHLPIEG